MNVLQWIQQNWLYSVPLGLFLVWAVCTFVESGACNKAGPKGRKVPDKRFFPRRVLVMQALSVFFYLLWDCCGQLFWRMGLRTVFLAACVLSLVLLAVVSRSAWRQVHRSVRPAAVARGFYLRRWMGCSIAGWFWGLFPAAVLQSVGLGGVDGAAHDLMRMFLPMTLPILFLVAVWVLSRPWKVDLNATEQQEKSFSDLMIEAQIHDLIQERIRQEEEENERRYREYWGDK